MACSIQSTRRPRTCGPAPHHSWVLPAPMIPMPKGKHRETIEMTIFKAVLFYTVFPIWYLKTLSLKADIVARKKHGRCAIWLSMGFIYQILKHDKQSEQYQAAHHLEHPPCSSFRSRASLLLVQETISGGIWRFTHMGLKRFS